MRKSFLTENKSNITLNFISKWVEYAHKLLFKLQGTKMNLGNKLSVFQMAVCDTVHKTKDYFPEDAGLLNLSMGTLKE